MLSFAARCPILAAYLFFAARVGDHETYLALPPRNVSLSKLF
jgi:hypothetical protein